MADRPQVYIPSQVHDIYQVHGNSEQNIEIRPRGTLDETSFPITPPSDHWAMRVLRRFFPMPQHDRGWVQNRAAVKMPLAVKCPTLSKPTRMYQVPGTRYQVPDSMKTGGYKKTVRLDLPADLPIDHARTPLGLSVGRAGGISNFHTDGPNSTPNIYQWLCRLHRVAVQVSRNDAAVQ